MGKLVAQNILALTPEQFRASVRPIVSDALFKARERLVALLAKDAARDALAAGFREFFEHYCGLGLVLAAYEAGLLSDFEGCDEFAVLNARVKIIEAQRKTSPLGRKSRWKGGGPVPGDALPTIKVCALSDAAFRAWLETLVNWQLFAARERIVKLLHPVTCQRAPTSTFGGEAGDARLKTAFCEFFVGYLELEQFLEDYDYEPDDGLELCPEIVEELAWSLAEAEAGTADLNGVAS